ncbi:MAG TPA: mechanosensitive ion channel family protein [Burkholderiales bacterium]|nr:mechanosensitive ion channel family protein [Burkholderiales bacterium]
MNETVAAIAAHYLPKALVAIALLLAGYFAGKWASRALEARLSRYMIDPPVRYLLEGAARVTVFGLFALLALQNLGVELMPLVAGLGILGAALALATQGVLGNVAAGLTIIFTRPFKVGDYISLAGVQGEVLEILLSSTTLGHADLSRVVIPNRKIVGEILHNYGGIRQLALEVNVPHEVDLGVALKAVEAVLRANARVLADPAPQVSVARLGDAAVTLSIAPWVEVGSYAAAAGEINQALLEAFRHRGIVRQSAAYIAAPEERFAARSAA